MSSRSVQTVPPDPKRSQSSKGPKTAFDPNGIEGIELVVDRSSPAADQVYEALRAAIIEVRLAPGAAITENSICRQFAISRTPVRAAIQRLQREGLVDVYPQLGSYVSKIDVEDLRDFHFVRRSLEVALVREAAKVWTPAMSASLRAAVDEQKRVIAKDDPDGFFAADEEFHRLFAVLSGHEGVWKSVLAAKTQLTRFYRYWAKPQRLPDVIEEHLAVVDALDRGDGEGAVRAMTRHLDMIFLIFDEMAASENETAV
ncbi:GntR family transcriptional regulator [Fulvimarina endophytica]|uniref:GntR family transcriptional regulator n=1 Tax=Fulvimarina endophytica TaxID=2293836 RepID=A0A371WYI3_9HYPH|nr:GntR family transcriptional regulator [Fulvimarina endophytica]RFC61996.1 GntR family transcriptional regulator [Fulvimarina endophytica]